MNRYVIADIHGCSKTLKLLIDKIELTKFDTLYFLGDLIDKGKDSAGVLDYVISLKDKGYNIRPIRGNHEENLLYAQENYSSKLFIGFVTKINKSGNLLNNKGRLIEKYQNFIKALPYFYELPDYWLVHSGFDTTREDFKENKQAMLESGKTIYCERLFKGKKVIHGHHVTYKEEIFAAIEEGRKIIPLDNGCVYNYENKKYDHKRTGNLYCLNLDSLELISIANAD